MELKEARAAIQNLQTARDVADYIGVTYSSFVWNFRKRPLDTRYRTFPIPKRRGGTRTILAPIDSVRDIQKRANVALSSIYYPKSSVHGFAPGRSIRSNAVFHARRRWVLNVDLEDFFPSINFGRVLRALEAPPYRIPHDAAVAFAQIACHEGKLPQGAPTSPMMSNLVVARMDGELEALAKEFRCGYTRYADDLTFSTNLPLFPSELAVIVSDHASVGELLTSVVVRNGFRINNAKVRLQRRGVRQVVTGLIVNSGVNVQRGAIRQIRAMLHAWRKFGLEAAQATYESSYALRKARNPNFPPARFENVVRGRLSFVAMIRGREDEIYRKLRDQYLVLLRAGEVDQVEPSPPSIPEESKVAKQQLEIIRVIVASPGDVMKERKQVDDAVDEINKTLAHPRGLHLEVWKWETDASPGFHPDGPQGRVDELMKIEDADIVIAIFWRRFGTPVVDAGSGTEHELRRAEEAWEANGRPLIWVYFSTEKYSPTPSDFEDGPKILALQNSLTKALWHKYQRRNFAKMIRKHFADFINTRKTA